MIKKEDKGNNAYVKNVFGIQVTEWKERSERGEVCGIFGCENTPVISCSHCGNWYCREHSLIHFHAV